MAASVESERRLFERFSARFPAKYKDTRADYGTNVFLRNASATGFQLASREQLFLNDHVTVEVELPDGFAPMELRGEVVWLRNMNQQMWEVGVNLHNLSFVRMARLYKFISKQ